MESLSADDPARKAQLKKKSPLNWHVQSPDQGPASLALKNREGFVSSSRGGRKLIRGRFRFHCDDWRICGNGVVYDLRPGWDEVRTHLLQAFMSGFARLTDFSAA